MIWAYKGITKINNETLFIVEDYLNKKMLSKLGYQFNFNELEQWEVEAYSIIENEFGRLNERQMKAKAKSRKR